MYVRGWGWAGRRLHFLYKLKGKEGHLLRVIRNGLEVSVRKDFGFKYPQIQLIVAYIPKALTA